MSPEIEKRLADIDAHVEQVASHRAGGSHVDVVLAHAIHNLIRCIRDLESRQG